MEQIGAKSRRFRDLRKSQSFLRAKAAADLYVAAFLLPKTGGAPAGASARTVPTTEELWMALNQGKIRTAMAEAPKAARAARALHWPLEFPDVMQRGGFNVVLGNPPWEVMQLADKEYFAARKPEIAALAGAARKKAIENLERSDPVLFQKFAIEKRSFDAGNEFARESGRFGLTARGKVNSYSLFAELFANLSSLSAGILVPTGIATDAGNAPFFSSLVDGKRLSSLFDFENRAGLFPAVHSSMKFALLTLGKNVFEARFSFFLHHTHELADQERSFALAPEEIGLLNPNTRSAPIFRSKADSEITLKAYRTASVLIAEHGPIPENTWGVEFRQGLFNMTSDSHLFKTADQLSGAGYKRDRSNWVRSEKPDDVWVPLYEAKMGDFFDHRASGYNSRGDERGYRILPETTLEEYADPNFDPDPYYWVSRGEVEACLSNIGWTRDWMFGFKLVTSPTNERTFFCNPLPRWGAGNSMCLLLPIQFQKSPLVSGLIANCSSLPFDFIARQKAGGVNLNFFYVKQFPFFSPNFYTEPRLTFVTPKVLELSYTSHSLAPFASDLGYDGPPFAWDEDRRAQLRADLDAFYARAYGLTRVELRYILDPADVKGPDYPSETFRVLKEKEIRQLGEYRTGRLVLAAWDRMEANGEFTAMGM